MSVVALAMTILAGYAMLGGLIGRLYYLREVERIAHEAPEYPEFREIDASMVAVLLGAFWPIGLPAIVGLGLVKRVCGSRCEARARGNLLRERDQEIQRCLESL